MTDIPGGQTDHGITGATDGPTPSDSSTAARCGHQLPSPCGEPPTGTIFHDDPTFKYYHAFVAAPAAAEGRSMFTGEPVTSTGAAPERPCPIADRCAASPYGGQIIQCPECGICALDHRPDVADHVWDPDEWQRLSQSEQPVAEVCRHTSVVTNSVRPNEIATLEVCENCGAWRHHLTWDEWTVWTLPKLAYRDSMKA